MKTCHDGSSFQVKLESMLSRSFTVESRVKQGSPALFIQVKDSLLHWLQPSGLGLSGNRFYASGSLHADIRTWIAVR